MRKGHIKLIEQAKQCGFSDKELKIIESSTLALVDLKVLTNMIAYIKQQYENAEEIEDVCLKLAGCDKNKPWAIGDTLGEIYFNVLDLNPSVEDLQWLYDITFEYLLNNENHNVYEVYFKWSPILYMNKNHFSKSKIDYIFSTHFLENGLRINRNEYHLKMIKILQSCIGDDFKHNDDNFCEWFLSQEVNLTGLYYARNKFDSLYNWENHEFTIDIRQFYCKETILTNEGHEQKTVLKLQKQKLYDLRFEKQKLYLYMYNFVKENFTDCSSDRDNKHHDLKYHKVYYSKAQTEKNLLDAHNLLKTKITASEQFDDITVLFSDSGYIYINMSFGETVVVSTNTEGITQIYPQTSQTYELMITPDELLFLRKKGKYGYGKFLPFKMTDLLLFLNRHTQGLHDLFEYLLKYYDTKTMLPRDIIRELKITPYIKFPFSFNDVLKYHNKNHFIIDNFKTAAQIPVNWNKRNIILSWLLIHSWNMLADDKSRQILMQTVDDSVLENNGEDYYSLNGSIKNDLCEKFLAKIIVERIADIIKTETQRKNKQQATEKEALLALASTGVLEDEREEFLYQYTGDGNAYRVAYDYVKMCRSFGKRRIRGKVNLNIKSYAQLQNRHDIFNRADRDYYECKTGKVVVPKDSNFIKLRSYLPDSFEWITDRKRLILETELQHHCVWSYADKITKDKCAIYSFVDSSAEYNDKPKRYTIEFGWNGEKYYVVQVQGRYDRVNAYNMREHIQSILDTCQG